MFCIKNFLKRQGQISMEIKQHHLQNACIECSYHVNLVNFIMLVHVSVRYKCPVLKCKFETIRKNYLYEKHIPQKHNNKQVYLVIIWIKSTLSLNFRSYISYIILFQFYFILVHLDSFCRSVCDVKILLPVWKRVPYTHILLQVILSSFDFIT